jgi:hypothetical protein
VTARELRIREARYQRAFARAEAARLARNDAIRALIAAGHTHADIYRMLNGTLSRARIGQIALGVTPASPRSAA